MAQRLFLALWPGAAERQALAEWRDAWTWPSGATPVPDEKLHLTLHFLGDVDEATVGTLLSAPEAKSGPIELEFGDPDLWHDTIAVIKPVEPPAALFDLHTALARQLADAGLVPEARPYRPHVTMARRAGGASAPAGRRLAWRADTYALVASCNGVYEPLRVFRCSDGD
jgi:2'-5' RNA ligase